MHLSGLQDCVHLTFVSFTVHEVYIKKKQIPEIKYINGMHAEVLEREWTDACNLFLNTSKTRWING